jgi:hypothetical protein
VSQPYLTDVLDQIQVSGKSFLTVVVKAHNAGGHSQEYFEPGEHGVGNDSEMLSISVTKYPSLPFISI